MRLFLLSVLLTGAAFTGASATLRTSTPSNETPGLNIPGTTLYWPQPSVVSLQMSNVVEVLALTTAPVVVTNWVRAGVIRNGSALPLLGRILVREDGNYMLAFRYSGTSDAPRNLLSEIFVNGIGTGIRAIQSHGTGIMESLSLVGLTSLQAGDLITVRISCLAGTANFTLSEAGLNVVQLFD